MDPTGFFDWVKRYEGPLNAAANEVLLPSKDYPTRNRLRSDALAVTVNRASPESISDFTVEGAVHLPLPALKQVSDMISPGEFDRLEESLLASPFAAEAKRGAGVAGVMWIWITCTVPRMTTTLRLVIGNDVVERRLAQEHNERWLDMLKALTAPGVRPYEVPYDKNNGILLGVKKSRTRRSAGKAKGGDGQKEGSR